MPKSPKEEPKQHGGARAGAGRKPKVEGYARRSLFMPRAHIEAIADLVREGTWPSFTDFVRAAVAEKFERTTTRPR